MLVVTLGVVIWSLSFVLMVLYTFLIRQYIRNWNGLAEWYIPKDWMAKTSVSVLVPARNEAKNIETCLLSILYQNFPKHLLEVFVIDDHSSDETAEIVQNISRQFDCVKLINLADFTSPQTQSYKKAALATAISQASGELIVTTDADCTASPSWLAHIVSFYENNDVVFVAAPVNFHIKNNLLEKFQALDYAGMMLITGAGIQGGDSWMSNGANLAYCRELFHELNGFEGIDEIASGDDMLFMQKVVKQFPNKIGFVKSREATVFSHAKKTWKSFLQQRLRWAGKTGFYNQKHLVFTQSVVFLYGVGILISAIGILFYHWYGVLLFCLLILVKGGNDFFLLRKATKFFESSALMKNFFFTEWIHTFYIFGVGLLSFFVKQHEWKGRKVK